MIRPRHYLLGIGVIALLAGLAPAADAQETGTPMPAMNGVQPMVKPDDTAKPTRQVPTGLPGASPGRGAAPADKSVADLSPNDALFDAINRGADLNAENVLGMMPLERSANLGRNDITVLLLSQHGASPGALTAKAAAAVTAAPTSATVPAKPARLVVRSSVPKSAPAPQPSSRQFAGSSDPGRPDPAVGFLGCSRANP